MNEPRISKVTIAFLRKCRKSSSEEVRVIAALVRRVAGIAPRKRRRIKVLRRQNRELLAQLVEHGLVDAHAATAELPWIHAREMREFAFPWCFAGGWALEIAMPEQSRRHKDIDIAILREHQFELRKHLEGWTFQKVVNGELSVWNEDEWLELPVHEIHASSPERPPRLTEFLLNERDGDVWRFRRDPKIALPIGLLIDDRVNGVPVLNAAVVLLYKAARPTPTDEEDMSAYGYFLTPEQRTWLIEALRLAYPNHPWIEVLEKKSPYCTWIDDPEDSRGSNPQIGWDESLPF